MCWPMGALFKTSILFCEDIRNMEFEALFWVEDFPAVETEINIAGIASHHSRSWTRGFYIDPIGLIKWIELLMCPPMQLTGSIWKQRDSGHVCPGSVANPMSEREPYYPSFELFFLITENKHVCKITLMQCFPFWPILHWIQVWHKRRAGVRTYWLWQRKKGASRVDIDQ